MTRNVLATDDQTDELRIAMIRSFDKLRGRLTADGAQEWIGHSKTLDRWVEGLLPFGGVSPLNQKVKKVLTPFITIKTGGTTTDRLIADIEAMPTEVTSYAKSMMAKEVFSVSKVSGTAALVSLTIAELGFTAVPRTDEFMTVEFCATWSAKNLDGQVIELCQPEDGPQLRKLWPDQPKGTAVWMAMERISGSDGDPGVWNVVRDSDGGRWLVGGWASPAYRWPLGRVVVFRLRKITQD